MSYLRRLGAKRENKLAACRKEGGAKDWDRAMDGLETVHDYVDNYLNEQVKTEKERKEMEMEVMITT